MSKTWLLVDSHNLAWKASYTMQNLDQGLTYGFLRQVSSLTSRFEVDGMVFAFDKGNPKRKELDPSYKANRHKNLNPQEQESLEEVRSEVTSLRREILPGLGFSNVFSQMGFEADDILASVTMNLPREDFAIVISTDQDLYQCISERCCVFNGKDKIGVQEFKKKFGIAPSKWASVKAMAGCLSDGIKGIPGVGQASALRYLKGDLPNKSQYYKRIQAGQEQAANALALVKLPFPGTRVFPLKEDTVTLEKWVSFAKRAKMPSLEGLYPASYKPLED